MLFRSDICQYDRKALPKMKTLKPLIPVGYYIVAFILICTTVATKRLDVVQTGATMGTDYNRIEGKG